MVVNIRTLKGRFIAHKFSTWWVVGVVKKSVEKKESVAYQFAVKYNPDDEVCILPHKFLWSDYSRKE